MSSESEEDEKNLLNLQTILNKRWQINSQIARGSFGQIYAATDLQQRRVVVIKAESSKKDRYFIEMEVSVLNQLRYRGIREHVPMLYDQGIDGDCKFLVINLLGQNLSYLRKSLKTAPQFTMSTACRLIAQMIICIETLHDVGYIHRDIKPQNFVMGRKPQNRTVHILDFGLCRQFIDKNKNVRPARKVLGFRGTVRYASLNTHNNLDMGRVDDIWPLFYIFVEMLKGKLPWRREGSNYEAVKSMKSSTSPEELLQGLPKEVTDFYRQFETLKYADTPPYDKMRAILYESVDCQSLSAPFDWEEEFVDKPDSNESEDAFSTYHDIKQKRQQQQQPQHANDQAKAEAAKVQELHVLM